MPTSFNTVAMPMNVLGQLGGGKDKLEHVFGVRLPEDLEDHLWRVACGWGTEHDVEVLTAWAVHVRMENQPQGRVVDLVAWFDKVRAFLERSMSDDWHHGKGDK